MNRELAKHWECVARGYLGPQANPERVQSMVVLKRLLACTESGIKLEAGPRHAQILIDMIGSTGGARVTTPMAKRSQGGGKPALVRAKQSTQIYSLLLA